MTLLQELDKMEGFGIAQAGMWLIEHATELREELKRAEQYHISARQLEIVTDAHNRIVAQLDRKEKELARVLSDGRHAVGELEGRIANLTSTVEAWNHAEIMKCGCKYNKVWGGMKWEHWLVPCKEHRAPMEARAK